MRISNAWKEKCWLEIQEQKCSQNSHQSNETLIIADMKFKIQTVLLLLLRMGLHLHSTHSHFLNACLHAVKYKIFFISFLIYLQLLILYWCSNLNVILDLNSSCFSVPASCLKHVNSLHPIMKPRLVLFFYNLKSGLRK